MLLSRSSQLRQSFKLASGDSHSCWRSIAAASLLEQLHWFTVVSTRSCLDQAIMYTRMPLVYTCGFCVVCSSIARNYGEEQNGAEK